MTKAKGAEYRANANAARKHAEMAISAVEKERWLKIAEGWDELADLHDPASRRD